MMGSIEKNFLLTKQVCIQNKKTTQTESSVVQAPAARARVVRMEGLCQSPKPN
jgi:hypothetical protein